MVSPNDDDSYESASVKFPDMGLDCMALVYSFLLMNIILVI